MITSTLWTVPVLFALSIPAIASAADEQSPTAVRIWEEPLVIPTYEIGPPDRNPRFYEGRVYQGAQGRVYPYPMYDVLTDTRRDKTYKAVFLENEYLKICVLPGLGGRVFSAQDKTNGYDFIYRQHVIKPALIGMLGAWISGGIEWDLPHHHRATSMLPVIYELKSNPDGSKTVWIGETELRHRMRWTVALTLRPGRSRLEAEVTLRNRTPFVRSFLYWANAAVHAGGDYQVIFPPRTPFAAYHGKKEFVHWPVAHEVYCGTDYRRGVDLSWWKNHPRPMSFFAWNHQDDFLAGIDHGEKAGIVHVADHHVVPGKKFWVWGPGPRGRMWEKILTDADGPYLELMVGAYSDNQPDYSWIQPCEVETARNCWYPLRGLEDVKKANLEAAVDLEVTGDGTAVIAFNTTAPRPGASVTVFARGAVLFRETVDIAPERPYERKIDLPSGTKEEDLRASLFSSEGRELISYRPVPEAGPEKMPEPVAPPPPPKEIGTVEELYFAGLRLEQFHHPTLNPGSYYEEALLRDPGDSRASRALGIESLERGLFEKAEVFFRTALKRATARYTRPRDGESFYYLGLALCFEGKKDAAYGAFSKAAWSYAFRTAAFRRLAELDCLEGDFHAALEHIDRAIATNTEANRLVNLKSAVLRRLGRCDEARRSSSSLLARDPLDLTAAYELHLAGAALGMEKEAARVLAALLGKMKGRVQSFLETAVEYADSGLWDEAIGILTLAADSEDPRVASFPMVHYYLGWLHDRRGDREKAAESFDRAGSMPADYCFPFRLESIAVLEAACERNPADARAHYYLGNLFYEGRPEAAIREWERARDLDDAFPTVHRNLGIAYSRVRHDAEGALRSLQRAVACDGNDPRLFYELDVIAEEAGMAPETRLDVLMRHRSVVAARDDSLSREIVLLVRLGAYDRALALLSSHHFHKWEGVGQIHEAYADAHMLRGCERLDAGRCREAIEDFEAALFYPENLEAAPRSGGGRSCQVNCFIGTAYEALGDEKAARAHFEKAAFGEAPPSGASPFAYWRGLALEALGRKEKASAIFDALIETGEKRLDEGGGTGLSFFAKFGEKTRRENRLADAHYLMGLGFLGKGRKERAKAEFAAALALNSGHVWAKRRLDALK